MAMKTKDDAAGVDRRGFLRSLGSSAAGTAVVAAGAISLGASAVNASESKAERVKKRYRESEHVKTYYRTNRY